MSIVIMYILFVFHLCLTLNTAAMPQNDPLHIANLTDIVSFLFFGVWSTQ